MADAVCPHSCTRDRAIKVGSRHEEACVQSEADELDPRGRYGPRGVEFRIQRNAAVIYIHEMAVVCSNTASHDSRIILIERWDTWSCSPPVMHISANVQLSERQPTSERNSAIVADLGSSGGEKTTASGMVNVSPGG